jgi:hypothetical protein
MITRRNAILKNFILENEKFKIQNPLADKYKVLSYTAELSKCHFIL